MPRILRTVLEEVVANTTDDPPTVHLKLHWAGGVHTELTVRKNRTGYHDHVNSQEVTELIRELALAANFVRYLDGSGGSRPEIGAGTDAPFAHLDHHGHLRTVRS